MSPCLIVIDALDCNSSFFDPSADTEGRHAASSTPVLVQHQYPDFSDFNGDHSPMMAVANLLSGLVVGVTVMFLSQLQSIKVLGLICGECETKQLIFHCSTVLLEPCFSHCW